MRGDGLDLFVSNTQEWHPPIYKFINRRHLSGLFKRGRIRIGTSTEYRIPDGLEDGRSDANELVSNWKPGAREVVVGPDHPFIKSLYGGKPKPAKPVTLVFQAETVLKMQSNSYVFSASNEYSDELARPIRESAVVESD